MQESNKGILVAVSGFSGAGKGTIMKELLKKYPNYALSVSATTRAPRKGEREGIEYFFKTREQFNEMISRDELLEYATYAGNSYGTPRSYVDKMLNEGRDVLLEIEVQGALQVKSIYPDLILIFIVAPSVMEIEHRLKERGTEKAEKIQERLSQIQREIGEAKKYDYILVNDDLDQCVEDFHNIIQTEKLKVKNNKSLLKKIEEEVKGGKR